MFMLPVFSDQHDFHRVEYFEIKEEHYWQPIRPAEIERSARHWLDGWIADQLPILCPALHSTYFTALSYLS